jgi:hypothetical protein
MATHAAKFALWIVTVPLASIAAESGPESAHFALTPQALYSAASSPAPANGSDISVLEMQEAYSFAADGSDVYKQHIIYKVLTSAGAEGWSDLSMNWSPWRDQRPVLRARVVSADGNEFTLDAATIVDSPIHQSDATVFSDEHTLHAPLPAISPGAVVETEISVHEGPIFAGSGRVARAFLQMNQPAGHLRLTLQAPASVPLRYHLDLLPNLHEVHSEDNGMAQWVFENGPVPAHETLERSVPGDIHMLPAVTFSTGESWQALAQAYSKIVDQRIAESDLGDLVTRIVKGRATNADKTAAIVEFLNREIRYTGIEFGQANVLPHSPSETLKRKYGDCKDKSTLLVAMLRTANIPADLALLNVGDRVDVPEELPGMGLFDHAIVYVPGETATWIDATDENARLGQIPDDDHARLALIVNARTTALSRVDEARSIDNVILEEREVRLQASGPASVVEISKPRGNFESDYRRRYADLNNKETKTNLTDYFKSEYRAKSLDRLERSAPTDFSQPFQLRLEGQHASRGYTNLVEASVYIRPGGLFASLPSDLKTREPTDNESADGAGASKKRKFDYDIGRPFVTEWRYEVVPPRGFSPATLPPDQTLSLGAARLTERFSADSDGTVRGILRFDSVKRRFTIAEQTELRNKVADLRDGDAIKIKFDLSAHVLLTNGRPRESFQAYRDLVASDPKNAINHTRRADALLTAGMGEAARTESLLAVKLDPRSAVVEKSLADVLQYDLIGRRRGPGADYLGAARAFKAAIALDPDDKSLVANYAILLEYNASGSRYATGADLQGAIAEYEKLTAQERLDLEIALNPAYALFHARQFEAAKRLLETINSPPMGLLIACESQLNGVPRALEEARRRTSSDASYKETLVAAGRMLMLVRQYADSSQFFAAGASGNNASDTLGLASVLGKATRSEDGRDDGTAADFVKRVFATSLQEGYSEEKLRLLESRSALEVSHLLTAEEADETAHEVRQAIMQAARAEIPLEVMTDLAIATIQIKSAGNDSVGYRERILIPGAAIATLFVVKEDGQYRLLGTNGRSASMAIEVLARVKRQDIAGAGQLLDWLREDARSATESDPYAGNVFSRFWAKNHADMSAHDITLAAAALAVQWWGTAPQGIALLEKAKSEAGNGAEIENLEFALMTGYASMRNWEKTAEFAAALMQHSPGSRTAFSHRVTSLIALARFAEADGLVRDRLTSDPDDLAAPRFLALNLAAQGKYAAAYEQALQNVSKADSEPSDINQAAWLSLFFERRGGPDLEAATRAVQMTKNSPSTLHTLAAVYAELDKVKEAREVLLQEMDANGLVQPGANEWYVFGRIAEQCGERDVALADYAKVAPPVDSRGASVSTYRLAQSRIARLGAAHR